MAVTQSKSVSHDELANAIRALTIDAIEKSQSGHPGMPMGMADVATVLFQQFLKFNPEDPHWADRDRFLLSAGHGSMLLYALLYLTGYEDMDMDQIKRFRQLGSRTAGHPEYGYAGGIETTTGPLGQGIANGVGMALAESILRQRHGEQFVNHYTYVIAGDGCLMEGISQEAISFAGHLKLNKLIVLFDDNGITIDGKTSLSTSEDHIGRFKACHWNTISIDGHDPVAIAKALTQAHNSDQPTLIACRTTIGYGAPKKGGTEKCHGSPLGAEEAAAAKAFLGWTAAPFEIPEDILHAWRAIGQRNKDTYKSWNAQDKKALQTTALPKELPQLFHDFCQEVLANPVAIATRQSSENVLKAIADHIPNLLGGSADLTGSNNTKTSSMQPITPEDHRGKYVYYGIREHAMGAMMNGLALHGFIPYGGTFLTFTDYCKPAIRLSALMHQRVIYVMTHDSIGLGEDGPTHQPIEHLWALRAIPNLLVFRPADTIETAECWLLALQHEKNPSVLALTRQALPIVRKDISENQSAKGGYTLKSSLKSQVTLIATGSEVQLALAVAEALEAAGTKASVVSMPCVELFDQQPEAYRQEVLGDGLRVAIEAGCTMGWHKYVNGGLIIGIDQFGASAPAKDLFPHFGFSVPSIINKINERI
jgi:transketolase